MAVTSNPDLPFLTALNLSTAEQPNPAFLTSPPSSFFLQPQSTEPPFL